MCDMMAAGLRATLLVGRLILKPPLGALGITRPTICGHLRHVPIARQRTRGGERGRSAHGRRDARIADQGRQAATGGIPTKPDAAHGRMRRAPYVERASVGGVTAAHPRQRARANRAAHRPRSGTQRCEMRRTGKRPHPNAIFRLRSGAGAMRNGAFRARVPLGRWTAHADRHPHTRHPHTRHHTHGIHTHRHPHTRHPHTQAPPTHRHPTHGTPRTPPHERHNTHQGTPP